MSIEEQSPVELRRRKGLLFSTLFLFLLLVGWLTYFLATFNLNDYRTDLAKQLSDTCGLPVELGKLNFTLHDIALALHASDIRIGGPEHDLEAHIPELWFDLRWSGLVRGRLDFLRIAIDRPVIRWSPAAVTAPARDGNLFAGLGLLGETRINGLALTNGTLQVVRSTGSVQTILQIHDFSGQATNLGTAQAASLDLHGELLTRSDPSAASPFRLIGVVDIPRFDHMQALPAFELDLKIAALDARSLLAFAAPGLPDDLLYGKAGLQLLAKSTDGQQVDLHVALDTADFAVKPGPAYREPVPIQELVVSGRWQRSGTRHQLDNLVLQIDDGRLAGDIRWAEDSSQDDEIRITSGDLPARLLSRWLPALPESLEPALEWLDLTRGSIWIEQGLINRKQTPGGTPGPWQLHHLQGKAGQFAWQHPDGPTMELSRLAFTQEDQTWILADGQLVYNGTPLDFTGQVQARNEAPATADIQLSSDLPVPEVIDSWLPTEKTFTLSGTVPVKGRIFGPVTALKLDLQADLSRLQLDYPPYVNLVPANDDRLVLNASLGEGRLNLEHLKMGWSTLQVRMSGQVPLDNPQTTELDILLTVPELAELANISPKLAGLSLTGRAELGIRQRGLTGDVTRDKTLTLQDAGLQTGGVIADISNLNGRIKLTDQGLVAEKLQLNLGASPVSLRATLPDVRTPVLSLDVIADRIRADELIFYSDTSYLYDLNGHLEIDAKAIRLSPVKVRLAGGTNPVIYGTITTSPQTAAELDITAKFADIAEIIDLWADETKEGEARRKAGAKSRGTPEHFPKVVIKARVEQGDLYGMSFHDASGIIEPTAEMLVIHPLDFHVGEGFCNAQVLVDFNDHGPLLLRISGHGEDVDALEVYQELLNQKNIVRGRLRGDFYLQGAIGETYLPTSYGQFKIEINDGVLHRFQVLSKVFSLMNVSQLFAFQLPDMDLEGMPFKQLTAQLALDHGVLSSSDLSIRSDAMNIAYEGSYNIIDRQLDLAMAVQPLGTVDKIVSSLPVAGWLLTGEDKALITAHFDIHGPADNASVTPAPISTLTNPTIGLLRRTLGLPFKLIEDPQILWGGETDKKETED